MAAFPLIKLGTLALRQISKPLANVLKERAKNSHFFRTRICMPPAQFYHWCEVTVKSRLLGIGKPKEVVKLNEQAAIDLGSDILGDMFIFAIGAAAVVAEYNRQSRSRLKEQAALEDRLSSIEDKNSELLDRSALIESRLSQLETFLNDLKKDFDQNIIKKKK